MARSISNLFPDLLTVTRDDITGLCEVIERHPALTTRDATHAATMFRHGLSTMVSVDTHFGSIHGIRQMDPADAARMLA